MNSSSSPCPPGMDDTFGPTVTTCRGGFDFTLLFEQSIMILGPAALVLLFAPYRLWWLTKEDVKVQRQWLYWAKQAFILLSASLQLTLLVLWASYPDQQNKASLAAASLSFIVAALLCFLSYLEHFRSVRPSTLIETYICFSIAMDAVQVRTLWLQQDTALAGVTSASLGVKLAVLLLEARGKRSLLKAGYKGLSLEVTSSVFSRSTFYWLRGLFKSGFASIIELNHLPALDERLLSRTVHERIQRSWNKANHSNKYALVIASFRGFWSPFLVALPPRVALIGFKYSQPFLITRVIEYVGKPDTETSANDGYGLIGATAIIYFGIAISTVIYKHTIYRVITMLRGALVSLIYHKTLVISDGAYDNSAALTLMSTDVDRIASSLQTVHEIWANFLELGLALYLLQRQVGVATVVSVGLVISGIFCSQQLAKRMGPKQAIWNKAVQHRVAVTSSSLNSMKGIKMMGLTDLFSERIQALRVAELELSKDFRKLIAWMNVNSNFGALVSPFVTFAVVYGIAGSVNVAQAFTSLAIISLLSGPLASLLSSIPSFAASLGSFGRIQSYLLSTERSDTRRYPEICSSPGSLPLTGLANDTELQPLKSSFKPQTAESRSPGDQSMLKLANISFGELQAIRSIDLEIPRSSVSMIIGPIGSGKSMLLRGLLGELPLSEGMMYISTKDVAYCSQDPWLVNASIYRNIVGPSDGGQEKDLLWYRTVISACGLDADISSFPEGDELVVGSGGLRLSGGQKQRVALARAVFSRKSLILLDDITSGLDAKTCDLVFERLLGSNGLLRQLGSTVILATHAVQYLSLADTVITLSADGTIATQGPPSKSDLPLDQVMDSDNIGEGDSLSNPLSKEDVPMKPKEENPSTRKDQDLNRKIGDLSIYKYYFKSIGWTNGLTYLTLYVGYVFFYEFPQVWLRFWSEASEQSPNDVNSGYYLGIYGMLTALSLIFVWATITFWFVVAIPDSASKLHLTLLTSVMRAPLSFFTSTDNGVTLNRFSQDMELVDQALPSAAFSTTFSVMACIAEAALISSGAGLVAVTIPPTILVLWVLQKFYLRTSRQLRFLDLEAKSPLYTHFTESLNGLHTIRAFGWQDHYIKTNGQLLNISQKPYYLLYCIQRWLSLILDLIVAAVAVLLVAIAIQDRSITSSGAIGVALVNVLGFNQSLSGLINSWTTLETSLGAISRLRTFEQETEDENRSGESFVPAGDWPQHGSIELSHVSSSPSLAYKDTIHNISLSIKAGAKVGICGPTGSGKSSLLLTLLRLFDLTSGTITIDGVDISRIPRNTLRQRITTIPQESFFLPGSVRYNLDPYNRNPDSVIIAALQRVNLWVLLEAGAGLETIVSDWPLSHGQKQLLCLAQALVSQSSILLLDEATSSVDVATEELVAKILAEDFRHSTIVAVAHRLNTIEGFDIVVVMEGGKAVESSAPSELLKIEGGKFRGLHETQGRV